jgi:uncharacterized protein YndB with AHSA1/START domain
MTESAHHYQRFVRAPVHDVWAAIATGDGIARWWHGTRYPEDLAEGADYVSVMPDGAEATRGTVLALQAPTRLQQTWQPLFSDAVAAERVGTLTWTLADLGGGLTRLRLAHTGLATSPRTAAGVRDGWEWLLDNLKSVLETGQALPPWDSAEDDGLAPDRHRELAVAVNNSIWPMLQMPERTTREGEELLRRAYTAAFHWSQTPKSTPENEIRANYMIGKAWLALGRPKDALTYGDRMIEDCLTHRIGDFDLAYAHELRARALLALGREEEGREAVARALAVEVSDDEDREIVEQDLADLTDPASG